MLLVPCMAAHQSSAEGQGASPSARKSFSQLFSQPSASPIQLRPVTTYKGEAAVIFSKEDADRLAAPFRWTLVGKFSHGRPTLEDIRKFLASLNLRDHVTVGLMDYRHVLIRCKAESDFSRLWTRGIWHLGRYPMRVFRWTRDFHVHKETPLVPVWVNLPALLIRFFLTNTRYFPSFLQWVSHCSWMPQRRQAHGQAWPGFVWNWIC